MSRLRLRNPQTSKTASKPKQRTAIIETKRRVAFQVHAPRNPSEPEDFARFVDDLNGQFTQVSDELANVPRFNVADFVRRDELESTIEEILERSDQELTSEGEDEVPARSRRGRTSSRRRRADELAEAAISNAQPNVTPPNVAAVSAIGSIAADGQIRFSYQNHTHGGIVGGVPNSGTAGQVLFYTSTFEVDGDDAFFWDNTAAKLRVGPVGNRIIVNYARSKILGIPLQAGTTAVRDFAYRRTFMSPRGVGAV